MKVNGTPMRSIWPVGDAAVGVIDQTLLPHRFETRLLESAAAVEHAIRTMVVRGAPLIGVTGAPTDSRWRCAPTRPTPPSPPRAPSCWRRGRPR